MISTKVRGRGGLGPRPLSRCMPNVTCRDPELLAQLQNAMARASLDAQLSALILVEKAMARDVLVLTEQIAQVSVKLESTLRAWNAKNPDKAITEEKLQYVFTEFESYMLSTRQKTSVTKETASSRIQRIENKKKLKSQIARPHTI
eukprot:SAG31_NODE_1120_length_9805_cov_8.220173_8_plen_146_part_00